MLLALANPVAVSESNPHLRLIRSATDWTLGTSTFTLQFGTATIANGQITAWVPSAYVPTIDLEVSLATGAWSANGQAGTLSPTDQQTLLTAMQNVAAQVSVLGPWALANLAAAVPQLAGATAVSGA